MKKALICPLQSVDHVIGWDETTTPYKPILEIYPNSARVAEVVDVAFEVAQPLFWVDCGDEIVADQFWYNTQTSEILPVENVPNPTPIVQPSVNGIESV